MALSGRCAEAGHNDLGTGTNGELQRARTGDSARRERSTRNAPGVLGELPLGRPRAASRAIRLIRLEECVNR